MLQKQCRRKIGLMKKAHEYSKLCGADVCVEIRIRETGQVHILSADTTGFWAFLTAQLVCCEILVWWKKADLLGLILSDSEYGYRPRLREEQGGYKRCHRAMKSSRHRYILLSEYTMF